MGRMTLSKALRIAMAGWAGIVLGLGISMFIAGLTLAAGVQVPSRAYASLANLLRVAPGTLKEFDEGMIPLPEGSPEYVRAVAFDKFNIPESAKQRLSKVPMRLGYPTPVAGMYDSGLNVVFIRQLYLQVVMHEYAHANYEQKPRWEKTAFAIALVRLWFETDPRYERPKKVLLSSFEMATKYANERLPFYPVHEMYAVLTEVTMGDLDALPPYLQPFYADYLQPAHPAGEGSGLPDK